MVGQIRKFLDQVIQRGGKINIAKSELLSTEVKYLGFFVGKKWNTHGPKVQTSPGGLSPAEIAQGISKILRNGPIL